MAHPVHAYVDTCVYTPTYSVTGRQDGSTIPRSWISIKMSNFIFKFVDGNVAPSFMFPVSFELVVLRELDPLSSSPLLAPLFLSYPLTARSQCRSKSITRNAVPHENSRMNPLSTDRNIESVSVCASVPLRRQINENNKKDIVWRERKGRLSFSFRSVLSSRRLLTLWSLIKREERSGVPLLSAPRRNSQDLSGAYNDVRSEFPSDKVDAKRPKETACT